MNKRGKNKSSSLDSFFSENRRAQFFLIAAVVIIIVVVSVVTITNYTQKKDVVKLYDLGQELGIESQNVLDYGTYSELNDEQMKTLMENFIRNYMDYIGKDKNIYFVFGNKDKINVVGYQEIAEESVCVNINPVGQKCENNVCMEGTGICSQSQVQCGTNCCSAGQKCEDNHCISATSCSTTSEVECGTSCCSVCIPYLTIGQTQEFAITNTEIQYVVIRIADVDYEFKLRSGENFYFVIWQSIGGEKHVITSES